MTETINTYKTTWSGVPAIGVTFKFLREGSSYCGQVILDPVTGTNGLPHPITLNFAINNDVPIANGVEIKGEYPKTWASPISYTTVLGEDTSETVILAMRLMTGVRDDLRYECIYSVNEGSGGEEGGDDGEEEIVEEGYQGGYGGGGAALREDGSNGHGRMSNCDGGDGADATLIGQDAAYGGSGATAYGYGCGGGGGSGGGGGGGGGYSWESINGDKDTTYFDGGIGGGGSRGGSGSPGIILIYY